MARARRAGRAADPGDQALRRRRPGDADAHAGLRDGPPRRGPLERRRDPEPGRARGRGHQLRRRAGARLVRRVDGGRSARTTSIRSTRRGWCPPSAAACGSRRLYAPNGRVVGSPFYEGKLRWFERLSRWLAETRSPDEPLVLGGDYNVTPADIDVWSPARAHGGTHVSEPEREALARLRGWGLVDTYRTQRPEAGRFSWWDYRAGMFHRNEGMRIDLLYATASVADARGLGGDRPRGAQGTADAVRPRARRHRPRRARPPVRRGLDGCDRADRRPDEAAPLTALRRGGGRHRSRVPPLPRPTATRSARCGSRQGSDVGAWTVARSLEGWFPARVVRRAHRPDAGLHLLRVLSMG